MTCTNKRDHVHDHVYGKRQAEKDVAQSVNARPSEIEVDRSIPVSFHRYLFRLSSDP